MTGPLAVFDDPDLARRFGSLDRLYGVAGGFKIRQAHVVVVGLGGVGSWVAEALAHSGVATLTLIDFDHVAESNINRQVQAVTETVGQAKVLAMQERIVQINPGCVVHSIEDFVTSENWTNLLSTDVDAVIDACDDMKAKTAMAVWALKVKPKNIGYITVGAAGGKRLAHRVSIDDISKTTHDPLLAQLRYRLRKSHGAKTNGKVIGIACTYSDEPIKTPAEICASEADCVVGGVQVGLNCHGYGSTVAVTATFGHCAAGWILDQLARKL